MLIGVTGSIGLTYLFLIIVGSFPNMYVPPQWIVAGLACAAMVSTPVCTLLVLQWARINALNARLSAAMAKLERRANTDQLTGLCNREAFYRAVGLDRGWLLLGDIDHFKAINDTHGHDVGDEVLSRVGKVIRDVVRDRGSCARIGGEEFAVFLRDASGASARVVAAQLRAAIATIDSVTPNGVRVRPTISLGVARADGAPISDVLRRADQAMYHAKRTGRDRVVCASDLIVDELRARLAVSA